MGLDMTLGRVPNGMIDPHLTIDADFGDDEDSDVLIDEGPVEIVVHIPEKFYCETENDLEIERRIRKEARTILKNMYDEHIGDFMWDVTSRENMDGRVVIKLDCKNIHKCDPVSEAVSLIYDNEFAYWRKFNALHLWFVKNCQNGVDQCQPSRRITMDDFQKLLQVLERAHDIFKSAIDTPAAREHAYKEYDPLKQADEQKVDWDFMLPEDSPYVRDLDSVFPTTAGFFFGQTSYGWWYFYDVNRTIEIVKDILQDPDFDDWDFRYVSSW